MLSNKNTAYRIAFGITICTVMILIWLGLGVGIIGRDGDPANRVYSVVVMIAVIGSIMSRCKPYGMSLTLITMGAAQTAIALIAIIKEQGLPWSGPMEILLLNAFFIAMFGIAAWAFFKAGRAN